MIWPYAQAESVSKFDRDHLGPLGNVHQVRPRCGISGIELMKAANVWRVEEAPVRRLLLRRAIGCTASEKEH
jgi:hypothetical protein